MKLKQLKQFLDIDDDLQWDVYDSWSQTDDFYDYVSQHCPEDIHTEEDYYRLHERYDFDFMPEDRYRLGLRTSRQLYPYVCCNTKTLLRCIGDNEGADELEVLDGI